MLSSTHNAPAIARNRNVIQDINGLERSLFKLAPSCWLHKLTDLFRFFTQALELYQPISYGSTIPGKSINFAKKKLIWKDSHQPHLLEARTN